jgi:hypothetical protein
VDNSVENSVRFVAKAHGVGILSDTGCPVALKKLNEINVFLPRLSLRLSDVSKSNEGSNLCISQVLTARFSFQNEPKARRY